LAKIVRDEWKVPPEMVANIAYNCIDYADCSGSKYEARRHNLLHSIIDGPIDADKIHYLQCDSIHTGNPVGGNFDAEQLIDALSFTPDFDAIGVTDKGLAAVESFLYSYYRMHVDVYWHHTVRGARKMVARAIDWYIKEPKAGVRQRRDKVRQAIILLTDRDFMTWLVAETKPESSAGQLIRHLVRVESRGEFTVVRPVRKVFKRFRTYTVSGRGDRKSQAIFGLLSQERDIDMLEWEKEVAQALSKIIKEPIAAWEVIIDIPRSEEGQMDPVCVSFPKVKQREYAHKLLDQFREIAKNIRESYVEDSRKIRIYCSPRIRAQLMAHEAELNPCILEAIRRCCETAH
jgi:HD superfamily phosphohydrolase